MGSENVYKRQDKRQCRAPESLIGRAGATGPANERLWGAALTLVILVVTLNLLARFIASKFSVKKK